jgi:hypothetical protein
MPRLVPLPGFRVGRSGFLSIGSYYSAVSYFRLALMPYECQIIVVNPQLVP